MPILFYVAFLNVVKVALTMSHTGLYKTDINDLFSTLAEVGSILSDATLLNLQCEEIIYVL